MTSQFLDLIVLDDRISISFNRESVSRLAPGSNRRTHAGVLYLVCELRSRANFIADCALECMRACGSPNRYFRGGGAHMRVPRRSNYMTAPTPKLEKSFLLKFSRNMSRNFVAAAS